jgi:uncharacterized protein
MLEISWKEYHQSIELLAKQIQESNYEFDRIVCLSRGGLRVGDILSRIFDRPLAILAARSYSGKNQQNRGKLEIATQLTFTGELGSQILLVDDLVDSGETLEQSKEWLANTYLDIQQIRTAVIWDKSCSICVPDYRCFVVSKKDGREDVKINWKLFS